MGHNFFFYIWLLVTPSDYNHVIQAWIREIHNRLHLGDWLLYVQLYNLSDYNNLFSSEPFQVVGFASSIVAPQPWVAAVDYLSGDFMQVSLDFFLRKVLQN